MTPTWEAPDPSAHCWETCREHVSGCRHDGPYDVVVSDIMRKRSLMILCENFTVSVCKHCTGHVLSSTCFFVVLVVDTYIGYLIIVVCWKKAKKSSLWPQSFHRVSKNQLAWAGQKQWTRISYDGIIVACGVSHHLLQETYESTLMESEY